MPAKCSYIVRDLQLFHLSFFNFKLVKEDLFFFFIGKATDRPCGNIVANPLQVVEILGGYLQGDIARLLWALFKHGFRFGGHFAVLNEDEVFAVRICPLFT